MKFPIEKWFDVSKPIPKMDMELVEDQMMLYALKEDDDPDSSECKRERSALRAAVKAHNKKLERNK